MRKYLFVHALNDVIVCLRWANRKRGQLVTEQDLWTQCRVRGTDKKCVLSGVIIKRGELAWSPVTHGSNRMDRISLDAMSKLRKQ